MSGLQATEKRALESPEDDPPSKRHRSTGLHPSPQQLMSSVEAYPLVNEGGAEDGSAEQIFWTSKALSKQRYDRDVQFIWDQTTIEDAAVLQMHQDWFSCRKHGLIDQLWTHRDQVNRKLRTSDKKHIFRSIAIFEILYSKAVDNEQLDVIDAVAVLLVDYIMMMVLFCTENSIMGEAEERFPAYKDRFVDLSQYLETKQSAKVDDRSLSAPSGPLGNLELAPSITNPVPIPEETRTLIQSMRVSRMSVSGLEAVVGSDWAKDVIGMAADMHMEFPHMADDPNMCRSLLLHGVSGTGKTTMAVSAASTTGHSTVYMVRSSSLLSRYVGDSEKNVAALFAIAQESAPAIICFDEIEGLFASGEKGESETGRRVVAELLTSMSLYHAGIMVIGVTNLPWLIGGRLLRRFDVRYHVSLLSTEEVTQILRLKAETLPCHSLENADFQQLGQTLNGFTGDDIQRVVRTAWLIGMIRLRRTPRTHYRAMLFHDRIVNVVCLSSHADSVLIQDSSQTVNLRPDPITVKNMEAAVAQTRSLIHN